MPFKKSFFLVCAITFSLTGCLHNQRIALEQCTASAQKNYPNPEKMPFGQPYKDIEACMLEDGYEPAYDTMQCRSLTYPGNILDASCYKPTNIFFQMFYNLEVLFRQISG